MGYLALQHCCVIAELIHSLLHSFFLASRRWRCGNRSQSGRDSLELHHFSIVRQRISVLIWLNSCRINYLLYSICVYGVREFSVSYSLRFFLFVAG
jgi:hypothetical protein